MTYCHGMSVRPWTTCRVRNCHIHIYVWYEFPTFEIVCLDWIDWQNPVNLQWSIRQQSNLSTELASEQLFFLFLPMLFQYPQLQWLPTSSLQMPTFLHLCWFKSSICLTTLLAVFCSIAYPAPFSLLNILGYGALLVSLPQVEIRYLFGPLIPTIRRRQLSIKVWNFFFPFCFYYWFVFFHIFLKRQFFFF